MPAATVSRHGDHMDVFLAAGTRCRTLALVPGRPWRWHEQPPHRRRYLTYSGPLPGRSPVQVRWRGTGSLRRGDGGLLLVLGSDRLLLRGNGVVQFLDATHCRPWRQPNWRRPAVRPPPR